MARHRKICRELKKVASSETEEDRDGEKVITSSESEEDRDGEKPGPSTEASPEVDLSEDLALSESEDSEEEEK